MANGGKGKEVKYRLGSNTTGQIRFDARYSRYLPSDGDNSEGEDATSEEDDSDASDLSSVSGGHAPTRKRRRQPQASLGLPHGALAQFQWRHSMSIITRHADEG